MSVENRNKMADTVTVNCQGGHELDDITPDGNRSDDNDYTWSDAASIDSNFESKEPRTRSKMRETNKQELAQLDDVVMDWLEDKAESRMNRTIVTSKEGDEQQWKAVQKELYKLNRRMELLECDNGKNEMKKLMKNRMLLIQDELMSELRQKLRNEMETKTSRMERQLEERVKEMEMKLDEKAKRREKEFEYQQG